MQTQAKFRWYNLVTKTAV